MLERFERRIFRCATKNHCAEFMELDQLDCKEHEPMESHFIEGKRIYLREVREDDIGETYYTWMNDSETNRYMETRYFPQGMDTLRSYVKAHTQKPDEPWFAICLQENDRHIGNIKLGPINFYHRTADVSYFIGEKDCWGKGYATEAIGLVVQFAFDVLDLYKVNAGTYAGNIGSQKALEKNGFVREGVFKKQVSSGGGRREDLFRFGLLRERRKMQ